MKGVLLKACLVSTVIRPGRVMHCWLSMSENQHMAKSQLQVGRVRELTKHSSRAGAAKWMKEKSQVFLSTAVE